MKKYYITAQELAPLLQISVPYAYEKVREMNEELRDQGYMVFQGKVPISFLKIKLFNFDIDWEEVENT